jgi:ATP-binding cassette subfamily F protein 3
MVSHDRLFLNKLVNEVWELDQKKINCYNGNLDSFVVQKEERLTLLQSQFEGQQQKIAELQSFIDRFGAKATKARQAQSRQKQIDKMELIEMPEDRSNMQFRFPPCPSSGKEVVTMKKAAVKFGEKTIFQNFTLILHWPSSENPKLEIRDQHNKLTMQCPYQPTIQKPQLQRTFPKAFASIS